MADLCSAYWDLLGIRCSGRSVGVDGPDMEGARDIELAGDNGGRDVSLHSFSCDLVVAFFLKRASPSSGSAVRDYLCFAILGLILTEIMQRSQHRGLLPRHLGRGAYLASPATRSLQALTEGFGIRFRSLI